MHQCTTKLPQSFGSRRIPEGSLHSQPDPRLTPFQPSNSSFSFLIFNHPTPFGLHYSLQKTHVIRMATQRKPLRILCFGDSLTEGYTNNGLNYIPYSDTLLQKLQSAPSLTSKYDITVDTDGMSGDQVTGSFRGRMEDCCISPPAVTSELASFEKNR
jgi:hypothetical protein